VFASKPALAQVPKGLNIGRKKARSFLRAVGAKPDQHTWFDKFIAVPYFKHA